MADAMQRLSVRAASRMTRRSFLGRSLGVVSAVIAGTAMPIVLPAARASARPGRCPPEFCTIGRRAIPGSCWFECGGRCCGDRVTQICDCCAGVGCSPTHGCGGRNCRSLVESFVRCTGMSC